MKINFSIINQSIDLGCLDDSKKAKTRQWFLRNCDIPVDIDNKDITDEMKKRLVGLALFEGYLDQEHFANQEKNFVIHTSGT